MSIVRTSRPFTSGPVPNRVLICGEKPGEIESRRGLPFVGKSGKEQRLYLKKSGLDVDDFYLTNVSKEYHYGNPDPTPQEVMSYVPILLQEIAEVQPQVIVAVGQFATDWFLGSGLKISDVSGVPHCIGCFNNNEWTSDLRSLTQAKVIPVIHPASGLRSEMMRTRVFWGYLQIARYIDNVLADEEIYCPTIDRFPDPSYYDVGGQELEQTLKLIGDRDALAIDTEGRPGCPWSIQICFDPGEAYCLRCIVSDFTVGIRALYKYFIQNNILVVLHNASTPMGCLYDVTLCREMGLDLSEFEIFDTMFDAYLRRAEPGSLKALGWRCAGMLMREYSETVGSTESQIRYLETVRDLAIPHLGKFEILESDSSIGSYSPRSFSSRALNFLKKNESGGYKNSEDLRTKWNNLSGSANRKKILEELKQELEFIIGSIPEVTLADLPLNEAVLYACGDADATFRVFLERGGIQAVTRKHLEGTEVLKIVERMQRKGMSCNPSFFEELIARIDIKLFEKERYISEMYGKGKPFNPNSSPGVAWLLDRNNVKTKKKTKKSGLTATGTDSIEHLRADVGLVDDILTCREWRKTKTFCRIVLKSKDDSGNVVRYKLKMSTSSQRLAGTDPNMLAIPKEDRHGFNIRQGFVCPNGCYFGGFDYGQQELRMLAHESKDKRLCEVFLKGRDIHTETGCLVFGVTKSQLKGSQRDAAKTINFGAVYGISAVSLRNQLAMKGILWDLAECKYFIETFFNVYTGVRRFKKDVLRSVRECGYLESLGGMRRYLPGIWDRDKRVRSECERQAVNHRIQGGSAHQTQKAMLWIDPQIEKLKREGFLVDWCLQLHDELIFIVERSAVRELKSVVLHGMVHHSGIKMRVPIVADGKFSHTWGGLK